MKTVNLKNFIVGCIVVLAFVLAIALLNWLALNNTWVAVIAPWIKKIIAWILVGFGIVVVVSFLGKIITEAYERRKSK